MSPVESDILFSVVNKLEKCIVAVLNDAIDQLQMGVSVHSIVKHQMMI